jgi:Flp pilus assembly protein TadD
MALPLPRLLPAFALFLAVAGHGADSTLDRALHLIDRGEFFAAEQLIEAQAKAKNPDPVAVWALSRVRTGQGHNEEAVKLAERALKLGGDQARFHAQLGAALMARLNEATRLDRTSFTARARKAFEKALSLEPGNVVALLGLSRFHWSLPAQYGGDLAKAQHYAERLRAADPAKGELELGAVAARRRDFTAALQHFESAAELDPKNVEAHVSCGNILMRLERLREARERYELALRIAPRSELARTALEALEQAQKPKTN